MEVYKYSVTSQYFVLYSREPPEEGAAKSFGQIVHVLIPCINTVIRNAHVSICEHEKRVAKGRLLIVFILRLVTRLKCFYM